MVRMVRRIRVLCAQPRDSWKTEFSGKIMVKLVSEPRLGRGRETWMVKEVGHFFPSKGKLMCEPGLGLQSIQGLERSEGNFG